MDFHHSSLAAFESRQAADDAPTGVDPTYWVTTLEWEQHCFDTAELGEMVASAIKEGLNFTVESCPF